jgi:hypothetical protein
MTKEGRRSEKGGLECIGHAELFRAYAEMKSKYTQEVME